MALLSSSNESLLPARAHFVGMLQGNDCFASRALPLLMYSGFKSMPIKFLFRARAARAVVPLPTKGSSTMPPSGHPALIGVSTSQAGRPPYCLAENGFVGIDQTQRLPLPAGCANLFLLRLREAAMSPSSRLSSIGQPASARLRKYQSLSHG